MATEKDIAIGNQVFGFKDDFGQFQRLLMVNLPRVHSFDQTAAQNFLHNTFGIDAEDTEPPQNRSDKTPSAHEMAYLTACLALGKVLLRAAGLPSFETERIIEFPAKSATKHRRVTLEIPVVEHMPARLYLNAYMTAFRLVTDFTKPISKRTALNKRADDLTTSLIKPIQHLSNGRPLDIFILKEAFERGIQIKHLGRAVYRLGNGSQARVFSRSSTERDAAIGFRTSQDKTTTLHWLRQGGVPTPRSISVSTVEQAQLAAGEIGFPVVIKPSDRDRSEGVTLDIGSAEEVREAFDAARKWSEKILVEERVAGVCHRLVTFRNTFVFAFTRHPKAIVGDGTATIKDLIDAANRKQDKQAKHIRGRIYPLDAEALACLAEQGLAPDSVPDNDQIVLLRRINTVEDGGHHEIITDKVHPENIKLAERVSRIMRLESMGLDLIATDATRPWYETGACVTEVNATPQIGTNSAKAYVEMTFGAQKGQIPVHCFIGDEAALDQARTCREELETSGLSAFLTNGTTTIGPNGDPVTLAHAIGLFDRASILLNDPDVDALVLVLHDDELLVRGRPMLDLSSVHIVNRSLRSFLDQQQSLRSDRIDALFGTLNAVAGRVDPTK